MAVLDDSVGRKALWCLSDYGHDLLLPMGEEEAQQHTAGVAPHTLP
jgi:hypothetical protein